MDINLSFDDVLLEPEYSTIISRLDVDTSTKIGTLSLKVPMISSPMDTVTESKMAIDIGRLGGLGVIHRFCSIDEQIEMIEDINNERIKDLNDLGYSDIKVVPAIGVTDSEKNRLDEIMNGYDDLYNHIDMLSIDIANGHSVWMRDMVKYARQHNDIPIMAGNIATKDGYKFMADLGVDAVRVGIGGGSICKTRIQTGFGIPTLQSLIYVNDARKELLSEGWSVDDLPSVIADGGIRYPADLAKSLAIGADAIICGGIFAGTDSAPGEIIIDNNKKKWKKYRGMASESVQIERRGGLKKGTVAEGVSAMIPYLGPLDKVIDEFVGGLRSAMTYGNAKTISEMRKVRLAKITQSGINESHAYGTRRI